MNSNFKTITVDYFKKRIIDLCLRSGLSGFPKQKKDQLILFKSAVLIMDNSTRMTENEVNEKLKYWLDEICKIEYFDYITLRRLLVDSGYLTRNKDGSCYQVGKIESQKYLFEEDIDQIDIIEIIENGREEIARKKRQYQNKEN